MRLAFILLTVVAIAGCNSSDVQARGDRLATDLQEAFPDKISAISFENAPPLDPPTLFIDVDPPMEPDDEKAFLCEAIKGQIDAAGGGIDATTSYGWSIGTDCP